MADLATSALTSASLFNTYALFHRKKERGEETLWSKATVRVKQHPLMLGNRYYISTFYRNEGKAVTIYINRCHAALSNQVCSHLQPISSQANTGAQPSSPIHLPKWTNSLMPCIWSHHSHLCKMVCKDLVAVHTHVNEDTRGKAMENQSFKL